MTVTYAIKDWDAVFENRRTREIACPDYVNWPTHQDSHGFAFLARTDTGTIALGMFGALVQFAAKRPLPRSGVLADERGPMTPERYSHRYGLPVAKARQAWLLLTSPEVGWLVPHGTCESRANGSALAATVAAPSADAPPTECRPCADSAPTDWIGLDRKGGDGTGKGHTPSAVADLPVGFVRFWEAYPSVRKAAKSRCFGVWRRCKLESRADEVLAALEGWKQTEQWTKDGGQYVCAPLVWLNQERWESVPVPVESTRIRRDMTAIIAAQEAALARNKR